MDVKVGGIRVRFRVGWVGLGRVGRGRSRANVKAKKKKKTILILAPHQQAIRFNP
jgi:hypothetical protein